MSAVAERPKLKRGVYLDALIQSYLDWGSKGGDVVRLPDGTWTYRFFSPEYQAVKAEIARLCEVQRGLGLGDYWSRME